MSSSQVQNLECHNIGQVYYIHTVGLLKIFTELSVLLFKFSNRSKLNEHLGYRLRNFGFTVGFGL